MQKMPSFFLLTATVSLSAFVLVACKGPTIAGITPIEYALQKEEDVPPPAQAPVPRSVRPVQEDFARPKPVASEEEFLPLSKLPPVPEVDVFSNTEEAPEIASTPKRDDTTEADRNEVDINEPAHIPLVKNLPDVGYQKLSDLPPPPDEGRIRPWKRNVVGSSNGFSASLTPQPVQQSRGPSLADLPFVEGADAQDVLTARNRSDDLEVVAVSLTPEDDPFAPTIGAYKMLPIEQPKAQENLPKISPEFKGKMNAPLDYALQTPEQRMQTKNEPIQTVYTSEDGEDKSFLMAEEEQVEQAQEPETKPLADHIEWKQEQPQYTGVLAKANPAPAQPAYQLPQFDPYTSHTPRVTAQQDETGLTQWQAQQQPTRPLLQPQRVMPQDGGVVVAEAKIIDPDPRAVHDHADCAGTGVGIEVNSTTESDMWLLDANGQPCTKPQVLFDGSSPVAARPPLKQGIEIALHNPFSPREVDRRTPVPPMEGGAPETPMAFAPTSPEEYVYTAGEQPPQPPQMMAEEPVAYEAIDTLYTAGEAGEIQDPLTSAVREWKGATPAHQAARREQAKADFLNDLADAQKYASGQLAIEYQRQVDELAKRLREAEMRSEIQTQQHERLIGRLKSTESKTEADRAHWRVQERELREKRASTEQEVTELKALNQRATMDYARREQEYQRKIAQLTSDLQAAEQRASTARQDMVLEAAKKIAEAERLAFAARMAKKDQMERQAMRLKLEGDMMLKRANDMSQGRSIMVPGMAEEFNETFPSGSELAALQPQAAPVTKTKVTDPFKVPPLGEVPVVVHAEDKNLEEIFTQIFTDLQPVMGPWTVVWELSGNNRALLEEKWSVTAETTFDDFLAFVRGRMAELHRVQLKFSRFDQSRRFVISD